MTRVRSPSYPSYSLEDAIENVSKVFDEDRTNPVDREVVARHLGYSGLNGAADKSLATLMQYHLLEKVAKGEVRVSPLAVDILHPDKAEQKKRALVESAYSPALFSELRDRFSEGVPSQSALKSYLVRKGFNDRAIGPILTAYSKTCAFLERENATESGSDVDQIEVESPQPDDDNVTHGGAKVDDFIQWESSGILQFMQPQRVRAVSADGDWVFVEESTTGIPMSEVTVEKVATAVQPSLVHPPEMPLPSAESKLGEPGETEWMRNKVGPKSTVRIMAKGEMGPKEIGKLIRLLEAQKEVLEED